MKKYFKFAMYFLAGALMSTSMVACSDDDDEPSNEEQTVSEKEVALKKALIPYVDHTVVPTYKGMADHAVALSKACDAMYEAFEAGKLTSDLVAKAGAEWKLSRKFWEQSEAFLFGAAGDYNIDPNIDSWPLDKNAMDDLLELIRKGHDWNIDNNAGYGLLGYHSLEYMLFELSKDGNTSLTHNTNYTKEELIYTCKVAEDLRNQCVRLEAAWAGMDNITSEKASFLTDAELEPTINYGESMKNAGQGGSLYKSYQDAAEEVLQGCMDICDEVGALKIGKPANGSSDEDKNYIESPYSLNSIVDFQDNIISIKNSYRGSQDGDASISDFIKSVDPSLDADVVKKIDAAIAAIAKIKEPFAKHATEPEADAAIAALEDLMGSLEKVTSELSK